MIHVFIYIAFFFYLLDIYSNISPRPLTSATLVRDPFRYRHRQSPAGELSDKVIHTLRRNLESYVRRLIDFFCFKSNSHYLEYSTMA